MNGERRAVSGARRARHTASRRLLWLSALSSLLLALLTTAFTPVAAQEPGSDQAANQPSGCMQCHGEPAFWQGGREHLHVTEADLQHDIHWQKGLRCQDCHGGDPSALEFAQAHSQEQGYRPLESPADVVKLCGECHAKTQFMQRFNPSPKTDQLVLYWQSGHGKRLQEKPDDDKVATCISCHGGAHGTRPVGDLQSPVYPTRVAETCAKCHADAQVMAGRTYHGKPIGHDQYQEWKTSVHAHMLLEQDDLSAPTCNDCHGSHGASPEGVESVANACGLCHVKTAELFANALMKHRFEEVGLPGCASCHGAHAIHAPTDQMLGMSETGVCSRCHEGGKFGATLAGAEAARTMSAALERLKGRIDQADIKLNQAQRLGMPVDELRYRLHDADGALVQARVQIHSFSPGIVEKAIGKGIDVAEEVDTGAQQAIREHYNRQIWLAVSLIPIAAVIALLLLYIRTLPPVETPSTDAAQAP